MNGLKIKSKNFNDFTFLEKDCNALMAEVTAFLSGKGNFAKPLVTGHMKLILDYYGVLFDIIAPKATTTHQGYESIRLKFVLMHQSGVLDVISC
jgi:hypothetical protein